MLGPADRELLLEVVDLPEADRRSFLERALAAQELSPTDAAERIESILQLASAHQSTPQSFLSVEAEAEPRSRSVPQIPGYEMVEVLGQGAFGTVYLARESGQIEREVAVKVLRNVNPSAFERFHAERQYLAGLVHPAIAKIFNAGSAADGRPYFAMERIHGAPITSHADQRSWSLDRRVDAFLGVCDGIAYAHRRGVIHADLKPSNILVAELDDSPRIIDFGVARTIADRGSEAAAQRSLAGTPAYMSPELVRGHAVDTRSDVYSLGVLLYELLVGVVPTRVSADASAGDGQIVAPSVALAQAAARGDGDGVASARATTAKRLRRRLLGDLDAIALCALHPEPDERYATVDALRSDIERSIARLPVLARGNGLQYRIRQALFRHRIMVSSALAIAVLWMGLWAGWRHLSRADLRADVSAQTAKDWSESASQVTDFFVSVLDSVGREGYVRNSASPVDVLRRATKNLDGAFPDRPLVEAKIREIVGAAYDRIGEADHARDQFEQLVVLYGNLDSGKGEGATRAWRARFNSVMSQEGRGKEDLLHSSLLQLEADAEDLHAPIDALDRIRLEGAIARSFLGLGNLSEAERRARAALARLEESNPSDDVALEGVQVHLVLSSVLQSTGRNTELVELLQDFDFAAFGEHLSPGEMASAWRELQDGVHLGEGRAFLANAEKVFDSACRERGILSASAMSSAMALGEAFERSQRYLDAEKVYRIAHSIQVHQSGARHSSVAPILTALGLVTARQGDPERALAMLRDSESMMDCKTKLAHRVGMACASGEVLFQLGRFSAALTAFEAAIRTERKRVSSDTMLVDSCRRQVCECLYQLNRFEESRTQIRQLIQDRKDRGGSLPTELASYYWIAGVCGVQLGERAAEKDLEEVYQLSVSYPNDVGLSLARVSALLLAKQLAQRGESEEAREWRERRDALPDPREAIPGDSPSETSADPNDR